MLHRVETIQRYEELRRRAEELAADQSYFRNIPKDCPCLDRYASYGVCSQDNGYGRWWYTRVRECLVCGVKKDVGTYDTWDEANAGVKK